MCETETSAITQAFTTFPVADATGTPLAADGIPDPGGLHFRLFPLFIDVPEMSSYFFEPAIQTCAPGTVVPDIEPDLTVAFVATTKMTSFEAAKRGASTLTSSPASAGDDNPDSAQSSGPTTLRSSPASAASDVPESAESSNHPTTSASQQDVPATSEQMDTPAASTVFTVGGTSVTLTAGQAPTALLITNQGGSTIVTTVSLLETSDSIVATGTESAASSSSSSSSGDLRTPLSGLWGLSCLLGHLALNL